MNLQVARLALELSNNIAGNPIGFHQRSSALETALAADEAALFGANNAVTDSDLLLTQLATPTGVAVTQGGTPGSTNYTYVVADVGNVGLAPAAGVQTTAGNATLSAANSNVISFASIPGHTYNIYRSASSGTPSGTGLIGTVTAVGTTTTFADTGIAATGNVPTVNTTGSAQIAGPALISGTIVQSAPPALSNAAGQTLTVAQMLGGYLLRSGAAGITDTTPTAAALVAGLTGIKAGQAVPWTLRNANTGTHTLAAGSGVTLAAGNTNTTATVSAHDFLLVFTNVTPGSEAVTIYSLCTSAY